MSLKNTYNAAKIIDIPQLKMNNAGNIKNAIKMFQLNTASPLIHTKSITPKSAIHENRKFTIKDFNVNVIKELKV